MTKPDILQIGPYPAWDLERLKKRFVLHRYFDAEDKEAFVRERADFIRGIATRGELGAGRVLINALPKLEIIAVNGVGYDAVDLEAARERGIHVTNTPDVLTKDVADFGIAMLLAAARGVVGGERWVRSRAWSKDGLYPLKTRVFGKRVGILGLGRIGFEVAKRCAAFDMDIAYTDLEPKDAAPNWHYLPDPVALADRSDFLFVTLTGGEATRHVVGPEVIAALGPDGMLLNISRASNIDEAALLSALETHALGFAALDVFEGEPNLDPRFLALDNVLLQPHMASGTVETRQAMGQLMFDNLAAHFDGRDLPTPVL
ncbi:2-hydroxyacid dehydrogenase [Magnetospira sp. QH-2]|uniref:2-hydroxyacid dehydrogenase n=1 Tax=Magnetospira sp. (strain QH-2) TaxID=1288970 RepID=UPI0003E80CEA|nr:2-hydroxyacid dehydrogenase [Magnetospira sp. QH-2]CCQ74474.1 putative D-isomer specific 2-hydroxyacid dehydrogenase [Magnetospira sp. QH-2]